MERIAIIGPGAMGMLFSYYLKSVCPELFLVDYRKERSELIKEKGVRVEIQGEIKTAQVKITVHPEEIGTMDLILVCVKAYSTRSAVKRALSLLSPESLILTLQNGLGNIETIQEIVRQEQILAGTTAMGANVIEPGFVRFAGAGESVIGSVQGGKEGAEKAERIAKLFREAGLEVKTTENLAGVIWSKVIVNVGINALTALLRVKNGRLLNYEESRKVMAEAVREAEAVAKAKGIRLLYEDPLAKVEEVARKTAENISSMLQDVRARRKTEVEAINGAMVKEAEQLGLKAPVNQVLTLLVKAVEQSYADQIC